MKVKPAEICAIRKMLDSGNPDPESWKHYAERLLDALDEVLDHIEPLREYI